MIAELADRMEDLLDELEQNSGSGSTGNGIEIWPRSESEILTEANRLHKLFDAEIGEMMFFGKALTMAIEKTKNEVMIHKKTKAD